jgi:serine protease Do
MKVSADWRANAGRGGRWLAAAVAVTMLVSQAGTGPSLAAGPESVADIAERLTPAVVNISTSQVDSGDGDSVPMPDLPEGSPFREFFEEFFNRQERDPQQPQRPRRVSSLGSGFVIDADGIIVTNNHVIEQADEVEVNFADGRR